jgi:hypothetical protein
VEAKQLCDEADNRHLTDTADATREHVGVSGCISSQVRTTTTSARYRSIVRVLDEQD